MASAQLVLDGRRRTVAWIEDVIVGNEHRGMGLGMALLAALLGWACERGATRAQLLADCTNESALAFYRRFGWQPTRLSAWRIALRK